MMECPTCRAPYQPGDKFCGSCGERLGDASPPAANVFAAAPPVPPRPAPPAPAMPPADAGAATLAVPPGFSGATPSFPAPPAPAPAPAPYAGAALGGAPAPARPAAGGGATCPTCSAPVEPGDTSCLVCGASLAPGGRRPATMTPESQEQEMRAGGAMCPIHGEMDPTWTRCPQCIREGRDGRLVSSSGYGAATAAPEQPARPATPAPGIAPSAYPPPPPVAPTPAPGMPQPSFAAPPPPAPAPPPPAIRETVPEPEPPRAAPAPAASSPAPAPAPPAPPPVPAMGSAEHPVSSVGGTVVIRRKPRALAFLIEKEGEQVGRVFQLEQDITDIGRDPRNHVVVGDVLVSGFHARLERSPSGDFVISDRGSTNGSRLNGEPLNRPLPFHENDEFGLGNTTLVLKVVG